MANPNFGIYTYYSYARSGLAAAVRASDSTAHAQTTVTLTLRRGADQEEVSTSLRLYGPGDVTGFDGKQVIRAEPPPGSTSALANNFPFVEFARPDFPWLFTPEATTADETRLRPWICLVAVPQRSGVTLKHQPSQPLPILSIQGEAHRELPDLTELWAWAHVQEAGRAANRPERIISRLLCPRKLEPNTGYFACVVPTYKVGLKTGLGEKLSSEDEEELGLGLAWEGEFDDIRLPVYYHYTFTTGRAGDFESLVKQLEPVLDLPEGLGYRDLDVSQAELGLEAIDFTPRLGSVFRPVGQERVPLDDVYKEKYLTLLNAQDPGQPDVLTPPLYGRWRAGVTDLPPDSPDAGWFPELNLDLRLRAAASFGTLVVQREQENLMASAWDQLDEVERAKELLRRLRAARVIGSSIHEKNLAPMPVSAYWLATQSVWRRTHFEHDGRTLTPRGHLMIPKQERAVRWLASGVVSAAFRRMARPRGALMKRLGSGGREPDGLLEAVNKGKVTGIPHNQHGYRQTPAPAGTAPVDNETLLRPLERDDIPLFQSDQSAGELLEDDLQDVFDNPETVEGFGEVLTAHSKRLVHRMEIPPQKRRTGVSNLDDLKNEVHTALNPEDTVPALATARVDEDVRADGDDPLAKLIVAPHFREPMQNALRDLSTALMVANLGGVPSESVTLLEPNTPFIEAFMIGLNHEMSRELLWRGYATDLQGTYFQHFWDRRVSLQANFHAGGVEGLRVDMSPIHHWDNDGRLGDHISGNGMVVLVIRGELMRRYPNATIYATEAVWIGNEPQDPSEPLPPRRPKAFHPDHQASARKLYPEFSGTIPPDVTYFGFNLTHAQAIGENGEPGWYLVIESPPTAAAFGFNEIVDPEEPPLDTITDWNDVSWRDVEGNTGLDNYPFVELDNNRLADSDAVSTGMEGEEAAWGASAAHMALVTLQRPVRLVIHADDFLGRLNTSSP